MSCVHLINTLHIYYLYTLFSIEAESSEKLVGLLYSQLMQSSITMQMETDCLCYSLLYSVYFLTLLKHYLSMDDFILCTFCQEKNIADED